MDDFLEIRQRLISNPDLEWFDGICNLLTKENHPTVSLLTNIIGVENQNIKKENRGSKFLIPFDKRFNWASINPDIDSDNADVNLEFLSFAGINFNLNIRDVTDRFGDYLVQSNVYDGGTQLFFHPIADKYTFTAISFDFEEEKENIKNTDGLLAHSVKFHFGHGLIKSRAGYSMIN